MDNCNYTLVPLDNNPLIIQSDHIKYLINSFPVQCLGKFDEVSEVANFDDIKAFEELSAFLEPLDKVLEEKSEFMEKQSELMKKPSDIIREPLEIILDLGALTCD